VTRPLLLALASAVCVAAAAAPLPEETVAAKVQRVYGRWVNPQDRCKYELVGSALRVSLGYGEHFLGHTAELPGTAPRTATVVTGDFTLVVRVAVPVRDQSGTGGGLAGLYAESDQDEQVVVYRQAGARDGRYSVRDRHLVRANRPASMGAGAPDLAGPVTLRIVRRGESAATAWSTDGVEWDALYEHTVGWRDRVTVGVFAENVQGRPVDITFDRCSLTQPKK
jgi:hypothetical protein